MSGTDGTGDSGPAHPETSKDLKAEREVDINTGKGIAGWVLRVEGRVLDVGSL